jgi:nitrite reductase/ring-hydroxylating ferredoxin subunit
MHTLTTCDGSLYIAGMSQPAEALAQLRRTGPQRAEPHAGWICVEDTAVRDGEILRVNDCPPVAVTRVAGEVVAFLDVCPHLGAMLSVEGEVRRGRVVCNVHGRAFRLLRDGERLRGAERSVTTFPVQVLDGCVHVSSRPVEPGSGDQRAMSGLRRLTRRVIASKEPAVAARHVPS